MFCQERGRVVKYFSVVLLDVLSCGVVALTQVLIHHAVVDMLAANTAPSLAAGHNMHHETSFFVAGAGTLMYTGHFKHSSLCRLQ